MTTPPREPRLITEPLGGSPLARLAQDGGMPASWYPPRPAATEEWRARAEEVCQGAPPEWLRRIRDACNASGRALERLTRVGDGRGVVVTSGQQPGLFGGPVYTWSKALSALAFADEIEEATGIATAPIFWAASDDADFAEASSTWFARPGGAQQITLRHRPDDGVQLADVALGDMTGLLADLEQACGSVADPRPIDAARRAYGSQGTIGGAYVELLRELLEPLGIVVLDAAHQSVSRLAHPVLVRALQEWSAVATALQRREGEIRAAGYEPQVREVEGRTLVFERVLTRRIRIPQERAADRAAAARPGCLAPNVLLRPVVERALLPTIAYMAGPGELSYFAQVSAVADALGLAPPMGLPRWSVTLLEPQVEDLLARYQLAAADFADPHRVESRFARTAWPREVSRNFERLRETLTGELATLRASLRDTPLLVSPAVVDGFERSIGWRLARFERRLSAAVKRQEAQAMHDLGTMRGALYPGGMRQERALNLLPFLAQHGLGLLERMRDEARRHARRLVRGGSTSDAGPSAVSIAAGRA